MFSLVNNLERLARGVCFFWHFGIFSALIILESLFRPILSIINKACDNYFSRTFKFRNAGEFLMVKASQGLFDVFGIRVITEFRTPIPKGPEENGVVMFTHGSNLDPPVIGILKMADLICIAATWPSYINFVAKKSLFKVPVLAQVMKVGNIIPIERENLSSAISTLKDSAEKCRVEKLTIGIAPEGTRRRSPSTGPDHLLPMKKGPFHVAKDCACDIIPASIIGANRLFPPGHILPKPGKKNEGNQRLGTLIVRYMEKIPRDEVASESIDDLREKVEKRLKVGLERVDDRVIFDTHEKPSKYFLFLLCVLYGFWSFILRFIM